LIAEGVPVNIRPVMSEKIKVAQYGLGPIGIESLKLAASKNWIDIVGGIDIDPNKIGKDLGEITKLDNLKGRQVYRSLDELIAKAKPDVVLHTTVSKFKAAYDQLEPLARNGISVVSSCEELLYPQLLNADLAAKLDKVAKAGGSRIIGTGVNPGFVMDVLPVCMTGVSRDVRAIHVQRVVNASTRREPLQRKIGSGWTPEEFRRLFKEGKAGHAGLKESLALIAHCMGWKYTDLTEVGDAMVADHDIKTKFLEVKKGQCCGLHQRAEAKVNGKVALTLDLKMYLDAKNPHDAIQIEGEPPLDVVVNGGVAGDHATVAALVNTAGRILKAPAGLLLMTDLAVPAWR
jgi:2,4-diaminopentanoate dehydrogenase